MQLLEPSESREVELMTSPSRKLSPNVAQIYLKSFLSARPKQFNNAPCLPNDYSRKSRKAIKLVSSIWNLPRAKGLGGNGWYQDIACQSFLRELCTTCPQPK